MSILNEDLLETCTANIQPTVSIHPEHLTFMMGEFVNIHGILKKGQDLIEDILSDVTIEEFSEQHIITACNHVISNKYKSRFVLEKKGERQWYYYIKKTKYTKPIGFLITI